MANFRNSAVAGLALLAAVGVTNSAKAQGVNVDQQGYNNTAVIDGVRTSGLIGINEFGNNNGAEVSHSKIDGPTTEHLYGDNNTAVVRGNPSILGPVQILAEGSGNQSSVAGVNQRPFTTRAARLAGHNH